MTRMVLESQRQRRWWLAGPGTVALACIALATLVSTGDLAAWMQHPLRSPNSETTLAGARLLRIMLVVAAAALVAAPLLLERLSPAVSRSGRANPPARRAIVATAVLVCIGLGLRLTRAGESLWYDEIAAWREYGQYGPGAIVGNFFDPSNHIGHTLLTWLAVAWLGADEIDLRAPALLFSLASIIATFAMVRCAAGDRPALIAAALTAALPVCVLEGAEARGYSMMMAFAAMATWTLLSIRRDERPAKWCLYAALCALGTWAHLVTVFVPIGHALWIGWRGGRGERAFMVRGLIALGLGAILTLTLYAPALPDLLRLRATFSAAAGDGPRLIGTEGVHLLWQLGGSWAWWAALPGLGLLMWGAAAAWRDERGRALLALALLGLPAMLVAVVLAGTWVYARFALFAVPGAIALMAIGLDDLWRRRRLPGIAALLVLLVAAAADLAARPPKQPLREAASYVQQRAAPGEPVVVIGLRHQVLDAYAGDLALVFTGEHGADLEAALAQTPARWAIAYYGRSVAPEHWQLLESRGFTRRARLPGWADWGNGDVEVWGRSGQQEAVSRKLKAES